MVELPSSLHWFSTVESAERVADPQSVQWDDVADLVVVGYGGAGVSAALEAAERGLSVLAIDRYQGGGATAMNGGIFYAGGGTVVQHQAGVEDSCDEMYKYLRLETQGVVSDATLRRFCEDSPATINWLISHGVKFDGSAYYPHKIFYPPSGYFLYYPDSSLSEVYRRHSRPAPRGHKVWHEPSKQLIGFGIHLTSPLAASAARLGVREMHYADARQLVLSNDGEVLGVSVLRIPTDLPQAVQYAALVDEAREVLLKLPSSMPGFSRLQKRADLLITQAKALQTSHGVRLRICAKRGVCLSAGGFIWNRAMVEHYAPKYRGTMAMGLPGGDEGSGVRLGQTAGAKPDLMSRMSSWRFINPPSAFAQGMLVNAKGERYVNEALYGAAIGKEMNESQDGIGYIIMDKKGWRASWREAVFGSLFPFMRLPMLLGLLFQTRKARTSEALARKVGFDPDIFRETLLNYNRLAEGRRKDAFSKAPTECKPVKSGPYYAVNVSAMTKFFPCSTMSLGGLRVDENSGEVLHADGRVIPGLYAAGRTAIGICSNIYVSGLSAADCVFSGRRAAQHAATNRPPSTRSAAA